MAISINLLPTKQKNLYKQQRLNSRIFILSVIFMSLVVGISAFLFFWLTLIKQENQITQSNIDSTKAKISELKPVQEKYSTLSDAIDQIKTLKDNGIDYEFYLREIAAMVPKQASISSINIKSLPEPSIDISSKAINRREAFKFYEKLKNSKDFANTSISSLVASDNNTQNSVDMTLNITLSPSNGENQ